MTTMDYINSYLQVECADRHTSVGMQNILIPSNADPMFYLLNFLTININLTYRTAHRPDERWP